MHPKQSWWIGLLLLSSAAAQAQVPANWDFPPDPDLYFTGPTQSPTGLLQERDVGPTPPQAIRTITDLLPINSTGQTRLEIYGWVDGGYTYSSTGPGLMNVEPRLNRWGDEYTLNQIAVDITKPLTKDWSWGFNALPYAGSDPAEVNPSKGAIILDPDSHMGLDFAELNLTAHLPVLTEGGIDLKLGRQSSEINGMSTKAPYRVFYSVDYPFYYETAGRYTGLTAACHVTPQLDILLTVNQGFSTFFAWQTVSPTGIGQIVYWLTEEKKTQLIFDVPDRAPDRWKRHSGDRAEYHPVRAAIDA